MTSPPSKVLDVDKIQEKAIHSVMEKSFFDKVDGDSEGLPFVQWVNHSERPEWADVKPYSIDERNITKHPIVEIAYSPEFKDTFDYLRAIISEDEISQRAFTLTGEAVMFNPASYTAWNYRRRIIDKLKLNLLYELDFISRIILDNPKNYQVWEHRRVIVEWLGDPAQEFIFLDAVFDDDAKNYHGWQYRQWLVKHFKLFTDKELQFTLKMINDDVRNNSAWNHRYFILFNCNELGDPMDTIQGLQDGDVLEREIRLVLNHLGNTCLNNESAWGYLRGIINGKPFHNFPSIVEFCQQQLNNNGQDIFLYEMQMEIISEKLSMLSLDQHNAITDGAKVELITAFDGLFTKLLQIDPIRHSYWNYFGNELRRSFETPTSS